MIRRVGHDVRYVKCRLGADDCDSYEDLDFVNMWNQVVRNTFSCSKMSSERIEHKESFGYTVEYEWSIETWVSRSSNIFERWCADPEQAAKSWIFLQHNSFPHNRTDLIPWSDEVRGTHLGFSSSGYAYFGEDESRSKQTRYYSQYCDYVDDSWTLVLETETQNIRLYEAVGKYLEGIPGAKKCELHDMVCRKRTTRFWKATWASLYRYDLKKVLHCIDERWIDWWWLWYFC